MSDGPAVTLAIVTYRSADALPASLAAARRCVEAGVARCVAVDNASDDATPALISAESAWLEPCLNNKNLGFGRGCNCGLERTTTRYVCFMNADVTIEPDAVRTMVEFMDAHPRCGIAAPATTVHAGHLQWAGGLPSPMGVLRPVSLVHARRRTIERGGEPFKTDWVCGAVFFARTDLMRQLGGFDPRFFLYFEETDLCLRVAKAGYELWAVGAAHSNHIVGASSESVGGGRVHGCIAAHYYPSRYYYLAKHHGWLAATVVEAADLALTTARGAARALTGRGATMLTERWKAPIFRMPGRDA